MKKLLVLVLLFCVTAAAKAQNYPSEWVKYTSDGYFHNIESARNTQNLPENRFKNDLADLARTNLSKQIQVKVQEVSTMDKNVVNGRSTILYNSIRNVSTDVDMNLAETRHYYDALTDKYFCIVFINKAEACNYYENDIRMIISNLNNKVNIADNYIAQGFKAKAKTELENAMPLLGSTAKSFFWLNVFGMPEYRLNQYLDQIHQLEQTIRSKIAELEHGTTYCIVCNADLFGSQYVKLGNEVKGELSATGCNFITDPSTADFVITINASAREYNKMNMGGSSAYLTYIDAAVTIDKVVTRQRIFEDEISVKGSHTLSYKEAARDGYKEISKKISKTLKENIKL